MCGPGTPDPNRNLNRTGSHACAKVKDASRYGCKVVPVLPFQVLLDKLTMSSGSIRGEVDRTMRDEWVVACRDMAGRKREVTVFVNDDRVVLVAPPGETAVLTSLDVGRLRAALRDAVMSTAEDPHGENHHKADSADHG